MKSERIRAFALALAMIPVTVFAVTGRGSAQEAEDPVYEPQAVGVMVIPAEIKPLEVIAMFAAAPIQRIRGIVPEVVGAEPEVVGAELEVVGAEPESVMTYLGNWKVTGYDVCVKCCGSTRGMTASGTTATVGRTCAAPKSIPFGTVLYIEGIGYRTVEDRGGAIKGNKIDVLCEDHDACYAITGTYNVYIVEEP